MASEVTVAFPVLPGKRETLFAFAAALQGERKAEYEQSQTSVTRESWFLQPTANGDLLLVHFAAPDPARVFLALGESQEPFDIWFRAQALEITGIDLTQSIGGLPEQVLHFTKG